MKNVIVLVDKDGGVTIDAVGFAGGACEKATAALEAAMGTPGKRDKKKEFYVAGTQSVGK